jgi:hypothetical protein
VSPGCAIELQSPGGRRHTNVWDGLGWRGYIVYVNKDNMSALNGPGR